MVIRRRVVVAAITLLTVVWLLFLVSDSRGWDEIFTSFGGRQLHEDNEDLVSSRAVIILFDSAHENR